jgi:4-hydroxybenzoate polyprenyltransferase
MTEAALPAFRIKVKGILALCRVSNLPTVWMNVLTALVLSSAGFSTGTFLLFAASLSAFYCGGMGLNDLFDRESDAALQPFRPIPAGRVSVAEARAITGGLFAVGLGLLALAPHASAVLPGALLLALVYLYDRLHKRHASAVFLMAGCRAMVFVVTGWGVAGWIGPLVVLAGAIQFVYTLLITVVSRFQNARPERFAFAMVPRMIAGMALVDGMVLAMTVAPVWLLAGIVAALITHLGQRYVPGD